MKVSAIQHNGLKIVLLLSIFVASLSATAQSRFELGLRGGASMLMYQSEYGQMSPSYNFGVDLLYSYRSAHVVGFRGGVSVDLAQSIFNMQNFNDFYSCVDYSTLSAGHSGVGGDLLNVKYSFESVSEAHNQLYASVPLQLALHFGNFAIFMGPKIAVPLSSTYKQELTAGKATVTYATYGVNIDGYEYVFNSTKETPKYSVCEGEITNVRGLRKYVDINIMASVDINYYIPVSKKSSFGIGLYCDYGLPFLYPNNAVVTPSKNSELWRSSLMWIDDPTSPAAATMKHAHNSVLDAVMVQDRSKYNESMQLISRVNYLSCGIRLSYNIGGQRIEAPKRWHKDLKKCQCVFTN